MAWHFNVVVIYDKKYHEFKFSQGQIAIIINLPKTSNSIRDKNNSFNYSMTSCLSKNKPKYNEVVGITQNFNRIHSKKLGSKSNKTG